MSPQPNDWGLNWKEEICLFLDAQVKLLGDQMPTIPINLLR